MPLTDTQLCTKPATDCELRKFWSPQYSTFSRALQRSNNTRQLTPLDTESPHTVGAHFPVSPRGQNVTRRHSPGGATLSPAFYCTQEDVSPFTGHYFNILLFQKPFVLQTANSQLPAPTEACLPLLMCSHPRDSLGSAEAEQSPASRTRFSAGHFQWHFISRNPTGISPVH